ncbi:MAG: hypothetical protein CL438_01200 [Acidimicrobiaceae bacterium]|nr:hypothetical protein [Acidimicrobiaceae bacterium]
MVASLCFVGMTSVSSAQAPGGVDSLTTTGAGAVMACTGFSGRLAATVTYTDGVDYDSASDTVFDSTYLTQGNLGLAFGDSGTYSKTVQYIVEDGNRGAGEAFDGGYQQEVDGNWVSFAYAIYESNGNFWSETPDALIGGKRIAFNCSTGELDSDLDKVFDSADNCPSVANADQANADGDSEGDACDTDDDGDGVIDANDNCPSVANADQANADGDREGDACDTDNDGDGVDDANDNCPSVANADQANADGDSEGDACDTSPNPQEPTSIPIEGDGDDEQDNESNNNESDIGESNDNESEDGEQVEEPLITDDENEASENSASDDIASEDSQDDSGKSETRTSENEASEDGGDAANKTDSGDFTINTRKEIGPKSSDGGPNTALIIILVVLGAAFLFAAGFFVNRRKALGALTKDEEPKKNLEDSWPTNGDRDFND